MVVKNWLNLTIDESILAILNDIYILIKCTKGFFDKRKITHKISSLEAKLEDCKCSVEVRESILNLVEKLVEEKNGGQQDKREELKNLDVRKLSGISIDEERRKAEIKKPQKVNRSRSATSQDELNESISNKSTKSDSSKKSSAKSSYRESISSSFEDSINMKWLERNKSKEATSNIRNTLEKKMNSLNLIEGTRETRNRQSTGNEFRLSRVGDAKDVERKSGQKSVSLQNQKVSEVETKDRKSTKNSTRNSKPSKSTDSSLNEILKKFSKTHKSQSQKPQIIQTQYASCRINTYSNNCHTVEIIKPQDTTKQKNYGDNDQKQSDLLFLIMENGQSAAFSKHQNFKNLSMFE